MLAMLVAMQQMGNGVTPANIRAQYDLESVYDARSIKMKNPVDCGFGR